jgi:hypothetical protein
VAWVSSQPLTGESAMLCCCSNSGGAAPAGTVFEAFDRAGELRAICGGGRYDRLLGTFGGQDVPMVGFGFGDAVIMELLEAKGLLPDGSHSIEDVVVCMDESLRKEACGVAARCESESMPVISVEQHSVCITGISLTPAGLRQESLHTLRRLDVHRPGWSSSLGRARVWVSWVHTRAGCGALAVMQAQVPGQESGQRLGRQEDEVGVQTCSTFKCQALDHCGGAGMGGWMCSCQGLGQQTGG